jgi:hypothetical protein
MDSLQATCIEDLTEDLAQDDVDGEGSEWDDEEEDGPLSDKEGHEVDGDGGTNGDRQCTNVSRQRRRNRPARSTSHIDADGGGPASHLSMSGSVTGFSSR